MLPSRFFAYRCHALLTALLAALCYWPAAGHSEDLHPALSCETGDDVASAQELRFEVVRTLPNRYSAFTQGLLFDAGTLYRSNGQYGGSSVEIIELPDSAAKHEHKLAPELFGEGLAAWEGQLVQLTWKSGKVFRYRQSDLALQATQTIEGDGWGLTASDTHLVSSDGSQFLSFRNPDTLEVERRVAVTFRDRPLNRINELEWVNGCVLANIWQTPVIVVIDPGSGKVRALLNLHRLMRQQVAANGKGIGVANGIAFDAASGHLYITGKHWHSLYEIRVPP